MPSEGIRLTGWHIAVLSFKLILSVGFCLFISPVKADSTGIVYIVFAIDTEPARVDPWQYEQLLDFSCFDKSGPNPMVAEIMDDDWRHKYRDSFGNRPRFSWFIMSHEAIRHATNGGCCSVFDALSYYREAISDYGDEIGWHYHHADWCDLDGDGKSSWNQLTTFNGSQYSHGTDLEIAEGLLNCLLLERGFFPTSFRAGWVWEDNDFSRWLENVIPFDFSANPPNKNGPSKQEPLRNQNDWSRAPRSYGGYHPHFEDYQKVGARKRWIFRTIAPNNRREWEKIFRAATDTSQILCFTAHSYDQLAADIDGFLPQLLQLAESAQVPIAFATASHAGAAISGKLESPPVTLELSKDGDKLLILADHPIFHEFPYCVLVDGSGNYRRVYPQADGDRRWSVDISHLSHFRFVCAACSRGGIPTIAEFSE